jgi:nucleotide-binding universal stress UspA family protein
MMINKVLVPISDTTHVQDAVAQAKAIGEASSSHINLLGLVQSDMDRFADPVEWYKAKTEKLQFFRKLAAQLKGQGTSVDFTPIETLQKEKFIRYVNEQNFDLIVVSDQDHITRALMRDILAYITVPVFFVRHLRTNSIRRILVPLDCSRRAECILPIASILAQSMNATLLLTHVMKTADRTTPNSSMERDDISEKESLEYMNNLCARLPNATEILNTRHHSVTAALRDVIKHEHVDLVMLSAHGASGKPDQFAGSIAYNLLKTSPTSLLILQDLPSEVPLMAEVKSGRYVGVRQA